MNTPILSLTAQVALAAYGQFSAVAKTNAEVFRNSLIVMLGDDPDKPTGFSPRQAAVFTNQVEIIIPTYNDALPGGSGESNFDVTVFRTKADAPGGANQIHIALRGTQQMGVLPGSAPSDLLDRTGYLSWADLATIDQIVAMYNWWQRESSPAGAQVAQYCWRSR